MTKTDKKIRHAYIKNLARVCACVPLNEPITEEVFKKMCSENWYYICSSSYSELVHNTAAVLIEEHYLRPIGIRMGFLNVGK